MAEQLPSTLLARLRMVSQVADGEAYNANVTWLEAPGKSYAQCHIHWRSARALVARGLLRYGETIEDSEGHSTVLHLTDAGRKLLAGSR